MCITQSCVWIGGFGAGHTTAHLVARLCTRTVYSWCTEIPDFVWDLFFLVAPTLRYLFFSFCYFSNLCLQEALHMLFKLGIEGLRALSRPHWKAQVTSSGRGEMTVRDQEGAAGRWSSFPRLLLFARCRSPLCPSLIALRIELSYKDRRRGMLGLSRRRRMKFSRRWRIKVLAACPPCVRCVERRPTSKFASAGAFRWLFAISGPLSRVWLTIRDYGDGPREAAGRVVRCPV
jgi:hypothetical protein